MIRIPTQPGIVDGGGKIAAGTIMFLAGLFIAWSAVDRGHSLGAWLSAAANITIGVTLAAKGIVWRRGGCFLEIDKNSVRIIKYGNLQFDGTLQHLAAITEDQGGYFLYPDMKHVYRVLRQAVPQELQEVLGAVTNAQQIAAADRL